MIIRLTDKARDDFARLPKHIAKRIFTKMEWFCVQENPMQFSSRLHGTSEPVFRFRVGDYRVICKEERGVVHILLILAVKDRKEAYRD